MYKKSHRNPIIETLRIISAFGVVAYHSKVPGMDIAYAGLIVFIILSPYVDLNYLANQRRPAKIIAKTFLSPWLFWMVAYGVINIASKKNIIPTSGNELSRILSGTSTHLWFMPFMCIFMIFLNSIKLKFNLYLMYYISLAIVFIIFINADLWALAIKDAISPYAQWIHAAPALLLGVALGLSEKITHGKKIFIALLLPLTYFTIIKRDLPGISTPYSIGILLFTIASLFKNNQNKIFYALQPIAKYSLGVYMVHMIWVGIYNKIIGRGHWASAILAFFSSLLFVWYVRKILPKAKLVL